MSRLSQLIAALLVLTIPSATLAQQQAAIEKLIQEKQTEIDSKLQSLATAKENLTLLEQELSKSEDERRPRLIVYFASGAFGALAFLNLSMAFVHSRLGGPPLSPRISRSNQIVILTAAIVSIVTLVYGSMKKTHKVRRLPKQIKELRELISQYELELLRDRAQLERLRSN